MQPPPPGQYPLLLADGAQEAARHSNSMHNHFRKGCSFQAQRHKQQQLPHHDCIQQLPASTKFVRPDVIQQTLADHTGPSAPMKAVTSHCVTACRAKQPPFHCQRA